MSSLNLHTLTRLGDQHVREPLLVALLDDGISRGDLDTVTWFLASQEPDFGEWQRTDVGGLYAVAATIAWALGDGITTRDYARCAAAHGSVLGTLVTDAVRSGQAFDVFARIIRSAREEVLRDAAAARPLRAVS